MMMLSKPSPGHHPHAFSGSYHFRANRPRRSLSSASCFCNSRHRPTAYHQLAIGSPDCSTHLHTRSCCSLHIYASPHPGDILGFPTLFQHRAVLVPSSVNAGNHSSSSSVPAADQNLAHQLHQFDRLTPSTFDTSNGNIAVRRTPPTFSFANCDRYSRSILLPLQARHFPP